MKRSVLATTTNSIENAEIEKYVDLISTNVVVGTNMFSDLGASLTDLFGGFSDTYQGKLQKIYQVAIDNLKMKASNLGANAIIGLKIDFDEISGKGKSMFMISAIGTAVKVAYKDNSSDESVNDSYSIIQNDKLEQEVSRRNIIIKVQKNYMPNQDEWIYLLNNPIEDISNTLLEKYLLSFNSSSSENVPSIQLLRAHLANYFKSLNRDFAIDILYAKLIDFPTQILEIIQSNNLLAPQNIINLLKNDKIELAIDCLSANMDFYSSDDLLLMQQILETFDNIPDKGKIDSVKSLLGKAKDKYICPNGHANNIDSVYCEDSFCNKNIKGLIRSQVQQVEGFRLKVDSLRALLDTN